MLPAHRSLGEGGSRQCLVPRLRASLTFSTSLGMTCAPPHRSTSQLSQKKYKTFIFQGPHSLFPSSPLSGAKLIVFASTRTSVCVFSSPVHSSLPVSPRFSSFSSSP